MKKYLLKVSLDHFAFGLTIPIVVIWQLSRGIDIAQVGLVIFIITLVTLLADIPTGVLSDRYGRKLSLVLGSATLGLSFIILALSQSFLIFCLYGILSGLGWALLSGAEEAYVFETSEGERKVYRNSLSNVMIVDEAATIFGLIGSGLMTKYFGLQQTISASAIILVAAAVISAIVLSEPKRHLSEIGQVEKKVMAGAVHFLKTHYRLFVIMLVFAIYYEGGRLLWQPQLVNHGIMLYQLGAVFALFKLFSIGGSFAAKKIALQKFKMPLVILGVIVSATFLVVSSNILVLMLVGFCVYSFAENYIRVLQSDYLNQAVTNHRAGFLSLNNIVRNTYGAGIAPFLGVIALSSVSNGFIFLAAAQIVAVAALILLVNDKR